ncbi:MAG: hypothetical protein KBC44_01640 [Candidatus Pacebacteria bacterium]|nr:hypothetical protein [Candidatus Paceibacterota bacterium]MBP9839666.1 hypothetical protein [Candidatus Paceibacterota bacterium]MDQ5922714.1 hypothetical protein [Patescibacteria group bacterium]
MDKNLFTKKEMQFIRKLNTPSKIQDFLNTIKFNFELKGETLKSPLRVIREKNAHCFEGALLGAYMLSLNGYRPLILHLQATKNDFDHVIVPFQKDKYWGALSKTNHSVLRYREPVYKNIRELVMSYFHEYFTKDGKKNLRRYSNPLDLRSIKSDWVSSQEDLWFIDKILDDVRHYDILPRRMLKNMRKADRIEILTGEMVEFKPNK